MSEAGDAGIDTNIWAPASFSVWSQCNEAVGDDNYYTVIVSGLDFIRVKLYIRTCLSVIRPTFNDKVVSINDKVVCGCHFITITINSDPLLSQEQKM